VLLDLRLPDMLAPEVVVGLRESVPAARIVVFTAHGDHHGVQAALDAGAHGALLKDAAATDLVSALRRVLRGERGSSDRPPEWSPGGGWAVCTAISGAARPWPAAG
jgi:Response regulator containing a CheY-like receiver domain and an HTH DNA-binding domain